MNDNTDMNEGGITKLMVACQADDVKEVQRFIEDKVNLKTVDHSKKTALHFCAENGNSSAAELLLDADPGIINCQDDDGYSALHLAIIASNVPLAKVLIGRGANVNAMDNEKHSTVHWATVCGQVDVIDLLISHNAVVSSPDIHHAYPIHYAAQMCGLTTDDGLERDTGMKVLRKLVQKRVPVDCLDKDKRQPLIWAASAGSGEACKLLITSGVKIDAKDKDGLTALHCAASRGHYECVEALIECSADVNAEDRNSCTPLFYSITLGHVRCAKILLECGADPSHQDKKGRSPGHCAAARGKMDLIEVLEEKKANLWLKNMSGDCPIHEAAMNHHTSIVKHLIEVSGYNRRRVANIGNDYGRTCLHAAAQSNNIDLCRYLLENDAYINAVLKSGPSKSEYQTPYDLAELKGNKDCSEYLRSLGASSGERVTHHAASVIIRTIQGGVHKIKSRRESNKMEKLEDAKYLSQDAATAENNENKFASREGKDEPSKQEVHPTRTDDVKATVDDASKQESLTEELHNKDKEYGTCESTDNEERNAKVEECNPDDEVEPETTSSSPKYPEHETKSLALDSAHEENDNHTSPARSKSGSSRSSSRSPSSKTRSRKSSSSKRSSRSHSFSSSSGKSSSKSRSPSVTTRTSRSSSSERKKNVTPMSRSCSPPQKCDEHDTTDGFESSEHETIAMTNETKRREKSPQHSPERPRTGYILRIDKIRQERARPKTATRSKLAKEVQWSVNHFEDTRKAVQELHRAKRLQVYTGYTTDKAVIKKLMNHYGKGTSLRSTTQPVPKTNNVETVNSITDWEKYLCGEIKVLNYLQEHKPLFKESNADQSSKQKKADDKYSSLNSVRSTSSEKSVSSDVKDKGSQKSVRDSQYYEHREKRLEWQRRKQNDIYQRTGPAYRSGTYREENVYRIDDTSQRPSYNTRTHTNQDRRLPRLPIQEANRAQTTSVGRQPNSERQQHSHTNGSRTPHSRANAKHPQQEASVAKGRLANSPAGNEKQPQRNTNSSQPGYSAAQLRLQICSKNTYITRDKFAKWTNYKLYDEDNQYVGIDKYVTMETIPRVQPLVYVSPYAPRRSRPGDYYIDHGDHGENGGECRNETKGVEPSSNRTGKKGDQGNKDGVWGREQGSNADCCGEVDGQQECRSDHSKSRGSKPQEQQGIVNGRSTGHGYKSNDC